MGERARRTKELVAEIVAASDEQGQGIEQVNIALAQIDQVTQSNASNAEESASAAEELNAMTETLQGVVVDMRSLITRGTSQGQSKGSASKRAEEYVLTGDQNYKRRELKETHTKSGSKNWAKEEVGSMSGFSKTESDVEEFDMSDF